MNNQEILDKNADLIKQHLKSTHKSICVLKDEIITADLEYRSLADIKRIAELEGFNVGLAEESCAQQKRIAELEKANKLLKQVEQIFNDSPDLEFSRFKEMFPSDFAAHDLEQQAKALSEYSEHLISEAEEIPIGLEHKGRGSNIYNWQTHFARELRYRANNLSNAKEALKEQVK
tara:strand:+ start:23 stop:547 length:525 start_codon:yes stop_codon:yes gene_type:complete